VKKERKKAAENKAECKTLSKSEQMKLAECEEAIQRSQSGFTLVGKALLEIQQGQLYKAEFRSFDRYCEDRWGFAGSHARRLMEACRLVEKLRSEIPKIGEEELPQNEFQARLYLALREEKHWVRSWKTVVKKAQEQKVPISAALIKEVCSPEAKAHPKAKAKVTRVVEPDTEIVEQALDLIAGAKYSIDTYKEDDWSMFLDRLERLLKGH